MESHNDVKTYQCNQCNYTGKSKRYFLSHIKNRHTGQRKRVEAKLVPCQKCGKLKREGPTLKAHFKKCGSGPARVNCNQCELEFKRKEDMQAHALIHYGQITCPIHNILFKQESEVFIHVNKAEPDDKFPKLECCMCGKVFKHSKYLPMGRFHFLSIHRKKIRIKNLPRLIWPKRIFYTRKNLVEII